MTPQMKAGRRALWLTLVMAAVIMLALFPATALAVPWPVTNSAELSDALSRSADGDVIQLTNSFTHSSPIVISGKRITLDVGTHTLTVQSDGRAISASGIESGLYLDDDQGG